MNSMAQWPLLLHIFVAHLRAVIAPAGPEKIIGLSAQLYKKDCRNILLL